MYKTQHLKINDVQSGIYLGVNIKIANRQSKLSEM